MKFTIAASMTATAALFLSLGAFAAAPRTTPPSARVTSSAPTGTHTTGQPNASCEDTPNTPGRSVSAPGSAFNPDGHSGTVYAGQQPQNSRNPFSVSQYDVACLR